MRTRSSAHQELYPALGADLQRRDRCRGSCGLAPWSAWKRGGGVAKAWRRASLGARTPPSASPSTPHLGAECGRGRPRTKSSTRYSALISSAETGAEGVAVLRRGRRGCAAGASRRLGAGLLLVRGRPRPHPPSTPHLGPQCGRGRPRTKSSTRYSALISSAETGAEGVAVLRRGRRGCAAGASRRLGAGLLLVRGRPRPHPLRPPHLGAECGRGRPRTKSWSPFPPSARWPPRATRRRTRTLPNVAPFPLLFAADVQRAV